MTFRDETLIDVTHFSK